MSELPHEIHWRGPYALWDKSPAKSIFNDESILGAGVYLWTVEKDERHHVMYVDMADNINHRMAEHLTNYLTGNYIVYDVDALGELERRPIYEPTSWSEFLKSHTDYAPTLHKQLGRLRFYVATLPGDETTLHRVESGVVKSIWDHASQPKDFLINDRLSIMITEQQKVQVPNRSPDVIEGLGDELSI